MRFNDILYYEKQRFTQPWIWLILGGVNVLFLYGFYIQVIMDKPFGDKPAPDGVLIIILLFLFALTYTILISRIETVLEKEGMRVRLFPLQIKFRQYPWESIRRAYTRTYNPLVEYGGWGLKGFGKNKAITISGNQGLQLEFKDGKRLLIGTKKTIEINSLLHKFPQLQR